MDEETFNKALTLLPLVNEEKFLFSCAYEPTLHPDFVTFLRRIPNEHSKKVFFTTNLAKKLSNELLEELSHIDIHHINISLDSFSPELYEKIRRGAQFDIFIDNLRRLVSIFSKNQKSPPIRYVTVVLRSNLSEIPELLKKCHTEYLASESEFRPPWIAPSNKDFLRNESLGYEELVELNRTLSKTPYKYHSYLISDTLSNDQGRKYLEQVKDPNRRLLYNGPSQTSLRILADGTVEFLERDISTHLRYIKDPFNLFKDILPILRIDAARAEELQLIANSGQLPTIPTELDFLISTVKRLKNDVLARLVYRGFVKPTLRLFLKLSSRK